MKGNPRGEVDSDHSQLNESSQMTQYHKIQAINWCTETKEDVVGQTGGRVYGTLTFLQAVVKPAYQGEWIEEPITLGRYGGKGYVRSVDVCETWTMDDPNDFISKYVVFYIPMEKVK